MTGAFREWPTDHRYLVGDDGSILGLRGRALRPLVRPDNGYLQVVVRGPDGHQMCRRVHVMVCETFHGPRPAGHEVAHENGQRADCRAVNLRWSTHADNVADKASHGTVQHGERNGNRRLTESDVREIRAAATTGETHRSIAVRFGITRANVGYIVRRETWGHVR